MCCTIIVPLHLPFLSLRGVNSPNLEVGNLSFIQETTSDSVRRPKWRSVLSQTQSLEAGFKSCSLHVPKLEPISLRRKKRKWTLR